MERNGLEIPIAVHPGMFSGTPHEDMACTDCHPGLDEDELPHAEPIPPAVVFCLDCHDDLATTHAFHTQFELLDEETILQPGQRCNECHGSHQIRYLDDPEFEFRGFRQTSHCGECHVEESLEYLHSAHAKVIEDEGNQAPICLDCHTSDAITGSNGYSNTPRKIRLANLCTGCHEDNPEVSGHTLYGTPFITSFSKSVHGTSLYEGNDEAPTCIDCHDSHAVARSSNVQSHVSHAQVISSCAQCHEQAAEDYLQSIHAEAVSMGYMDSPDCTDCHGEHNILSNADPNSPVAAANLAEQVCGECHGSVRLTERYGMPVDRLTTFEDSFHGLATRGGAIEAVNCASCHGYHDIRAGTDPNSRVNPYNLARTCGNCHEGANERFSIGKVHVSIDAASKEPALHWIATIYIWGILLIVGGMLIHNGTDFFHKVREKAGTHRPHHVHKPNGTPHRLYLRMTVNERLQHGLMVLSFVVLVITGFMLRYPEAWWVEALRELSTNLFEWRGWAHRVAGVVMCIAGIWHISYITLTQRGRQLIVALLPRVKDLSDMKGVLWYNLGLAKDKPLFERFSYIEKTEYWALIWGSVVMTLTGFLLWYENVTIGYLTLLGFDIALTIHFYEAILATLAIIIWHFYFVIFNPDIYPMNLSWLTGRLSEEEMETEHPLELERILKEEAEARKGSSLSEKGEDS